MRHLTIEGQLRRELDLVLVRLEERGRAALIDACSEVRDGSYGICEECGGTIPQARRRALPGVTTCLKCQERGERLGAQPPTPDRIPRRPRVRDKTGGPDEGGI